MDWNQPQSAPQPPMFGGLGEPIGGQSQNSSGFGSQSQSSGGGAGSQEPAWDDPDTFNDLTFGLGTGASTTGKFI